MKILWRALGIKALASIGLHLILCPVCRCVHTKLGGAHMDHDENLNRWTGTVPEAKAVVVYSEVRLKNGLSYTLALFVVGKVQSIICNYSTQQRVIVLGKLNILDCLLIYFICMITVQFRREAYSIWIQQELGLCVCRHSGTLGRHSSPPSDPESLSGVILIQITPW